MKDAARYKETESLRTRSESIAYLLRGKAKVSITRWHFGGIYSEASRKSIRGNDRKLLNDTRQARHLHLDGHIRRLIHHHTSVRFSSMDIRSPCGASSMCESDRNPEPGWGGVGPDAFHAITHPITQLLALMGSGF